LKRHKRQPPQEAQDQQALAQCGVDDDAKSTHMQLKQPGCMAAEESGKDGAWLESFMAEVRVLSRVRKEMACWDVGVWRGQLAAAQTL
jgi:hypothetical protein